MSIHSELPALPHGAYAQAPSQPSLPTPPGIPVSSTAQDALHNRLVGRDPSRQFEPFALPADPEAGAASSSVVDISAAAANRSNHELSRSSSDATSNLLSRSPSDVSSADVRSATSHVYVVHHDGGRPPVTVYTADGTEVVELPPRYNETASPPPPPEPAAASSSAPPPQTERSDLPKPPLSPGRLSVTNP
ncbi:hypothetical protein EIP86_009858 [Pleurotus ostreatoroseus]|nr:hypothetical protein EIP86_009858 [Pleurotus ostreatoroseus]